MTQIKYESMSDQELKRYLIEHRDDQAAFYAYMDRRYARSNREPIAPDDPDWENKVLSSIQTQIGDS